MPERGRLVRYQSEKREALLIKIGIWAATGYVALICWRTIRPRSDERNFLLRQMKFYISSAVFYMENKTH